MGRGPGPDEVGDGDEREPGVGIEFEVVEDFVDDDPADRANRARTRRGWAAGIAVAGFAIASVVVLIDRAGDEEATSPASTPATMTTAVSSPPERSGDVPAAGDGLTMPEFEGITVPTLPAGDTPPADPAGRPVLLDAVRRLRVDAPRRSTTRVSLGYGGFETAATILRDPVTDRYLLTVDTGTGATTASSTAIIDGRTELAYVASDDGTWSEVDVGDLAAEYDLPDVGELYRRLLSGPVRPDTIELADIAPPGSAALDGGRTDGAFRLRLPGEAVPLWQVHFLAPSSQFDPNAWPTALVYDVYVDGEITAVIGVSEVDGVPQLVDHRIERLPQRVPITLPD